MRELARAKINLSLEIIGRRGDGYHNLQTLAVFADIGDFVSIIPASETSLHISSAFANALSTKDNILLKTLDIFNNAAKQSRQYKICLEKNLPVAAGIGGGSADAAALLRLLNKQLDAPLDSEIMLAMAAQIGADVAMCLYSQPVIAEGVGDILTPLTRLPGLNLVLVNPLLPLSTRDVFKAYTPIASKPTPIPVEAMNFAELISLLEKHPNHLEETAKALMPQVGEIITALRSTHKCLLARMSGSGATCFGIFESTEKANHAAQTLKAHFPGYWIVPCST